MKTNKILVISFAVLAVLLYTASVVNFTMGKVGDGITDLLMALPDSLFAYAIYRMELHRQAIQRIAKAGLNFLDQLKNGVEVKVSRIDDEEEEEDDEEEDDDVVEEKKDAASAVKEIEAMIDENRKFGEELGRLKEEYKQKAADSPDTEDGGATVVE